MEGVQSQFLLPCLLAFASKVNQLMDPLVDVDFPVDEVSYISDDASAMFYSRDSLRAFARRLREFEEKCKRFLKHTVCSRGWLLYVVMGEKGTRH